jgi:cell division protein FtsB
MSSKKPAIPVPGSGLFDTAVKECIERMMGRRGGKVALLSALSALQSPAVSSGVLATDYLDLREDIAALRADVDILRVTINELLTQLEDV